MIQVIVSNNIGLISVKDKINSYRFDEASIVPKNKQPKKVLPTSPMKILLGYQFQSKKPRSAPDIVNSDGLYFIEIERYTINIQPPINPSIPSIKFVKFITAVPNTKRNNIKKKQIKLLVFILNNLFDCSCNKCIKIKEKTDINCIEYLIFDEIFNLSSTNPINANGKQIKGMKFLKRIANNTV